MHTIKTKLFSFCLACAMFFGIVTAVGILPVVAIGSRTENGFTYTVENGSATVTAYVGAETIVNLPSILGGVMVTAIGNGAFRGNETLTQIIFPPQISVIGNNAFDSCTSLTSVHLPAQIRKMGTAVFYNCTALETATFDQSCTLNSLPAHSFAYCRKLCQITLPDNMEQIHAASFYFCRGMEEITLPNCLRFLGSGAFGYCDALQNINFNQTEQIDSQAFMNCTQLKKLDLPVSMKKIGENAFAHCTALADISFPADCAIGKAAFEDTAFANVWDHWKNGILLSNNCVLSTNDDVSDQVILPDGTIQIADGAFRDRNITQLILPQTLKRVGTEAFLGCNKLEKVSVLGKTTVLEKNCIGYRFEDGVLRKNETLQIYALSLSLADTYAQENGFSFTVLDDWNNPFSDITKGAWYYNAVSYVQQNGFFNGIDPITFAPDSPMTRGMMVTVLYRISDSPQTEPTAIFSDVPTNCYYTLPVAWANKYQLVFGVTPSLFAPNNNITRQDIAVILFRYVKQMNLDSQAIASLAAFADEGDISGYALKAMTWAVGTELIRGDDDKCLSPKGDATRAQIATIMMRFCQQYQISAS